MWRRYVLIISFLQIYNCIDIPQIRGGSVYDSNGIDVINEIFKITADSVVLKLFGIYLNKINFITLTAKSIESSSTCEDGKFPEYLKILKDTSTDFKLDVLYSYASVFTKNEKLYLCVNYKDANNDDVWVHQGNAVILVLVKPGWKLPLWVAIFLCACLILISGLFSGLNIGLMSLTPKELKLIIATGTPNEQKYAKSILPLRMKGNILLCAILFGNTMVNSATTILLDSLTNGVSAIIITTCTVVIFGEIIPQSICAKYGLFVGSITRFFMWFFIAITSPLCFPLGLLLNFLIGNDTPTVFNRQQLLEMVRVNCQGNLEADEEAIIFGALKFKSKIVEDIMTPLDRCYMINENAILDYETISDIVQSGYSRIPVYSSSNKNIVALLHTKDLTFIDPDDKIPLFSLLNFHNHPVIKVFPDITIDLILKEFKKGIGHLAIVIAIKYEKDQDPVYEAVGIVTLEDVLEEIIQTEIEDETDIKVASTRAHIDGQAIRNSIRHHHRDTFKKYHRVCFELTAPLNASICQFLAKNLDFFSDKYISFTILRRLISHPGIAIKYGDKEIEKYLYKEGVSSNSFTLIIEGNVELTYGNETNVSIKGPYSFYGESALSETIKKIDTDIDIKLTTFIPNFSLKIIEPISFIKISTSIYHTALQATILERNRKKLGDSIDGIWDDVANVKNIIREDSLNSYKSSSLNPNVIIITSNQNITSDKSNK